VRELTGFDPKGQLQTLWVKRQTRFLSTQRVRFLYPLGLNPLNFMAVVFETYKVCCQNYIVL